MIITAGIDVGASAVKAAIMVCPDHGGREQEGAEPVGLHVERIRRRDTAEVVEIAFAEALRKAGAGREELAYIATTGEGEGIPFRTGHFFGMTSHARGAIFLAPDARAALDVGGLHARAIKMDGRSRVLAYRMTSQCASGSGQFLENIARYLGVTLQEIGALSRTSANPVKVSGICAVLAETDVINMVTRGIPVPDILKGIHQTMANRYVRLLRAAGAEGLVLATGGLAQDEGLVACLRDEAEQSNMPFTIAADPGAVYAGAIGAALWGAYRHGRIAQGSQAS